MRCERCGESIPVGGRGPVPRFCSTRCRVAAHRARRQLPAELTGRAQWVRRTADKRPLTVDGGAASSTDPTTWASYTAARRARVGVGLGFVLGDGVACIDIDHCLIDGVPDARAQAVLGRTPGAYVEVSPSGDGLHVWGTAPERPGRRRGGVEIYSAGRYITVTGKVFQPGGLVDLSEFL